jgi:LPXTG-site transpeptidase (sortase) family protein
MPKHKINLFIFLFVLVFITLSSSLYVLPVSSHDNNSENHQSDEHHDNDEHHHGDNHDDDHGTTPTRTPSNKPSCNPTKPPQPTPTDQSPTVSPSVPTPTPTNAPPAPTPTEVPQVTPSLIPTPTAVPAITSTPDTGNNGSNNGNPGVPVCTDAKPGTPTNLRLTIVSASSVRLAWDHSSGPHTSYLVAYGPSSGKYPYGNPDIGNDNSYVVSSLNPGTNYCFYVQAQNGCMPGERSNEVCLQSISSARLSSVLGSFDNFNPLIEGIKKSFGGEVLGASTELAGTAENTPTKDKLPTNNVLDQDHFISIPAIGVNQPVYLAQLIGGRLIVGQHEVLYSRQSNLYYGHNGFDVFGPIYKLKNDDQISVTKNGQTQNYKVTQIIFAKDTDIDAVKTNNASDIVLMTCSVAFPDHRIIVKASIQ